MLLSFFWLTLSNNHNNSSEDEDAAHALSFMHSSPVDGMAPSMPLHLPPSLSLDAPMMPPRNHHSHSHHYNMPPMTTYGQMSNAHGVMALPAHPVPITVFHRDVPDLVPETQSDKKSKASRITITPSKNTTTIDHSNNSTNAQRQLNYEKNLRTIAQSPDHSRAEEAQILLSFLNVKNLDGDEKVEMEEKKKASKTPSPKKGVVGMKRDRSPYFDQQSKRSNLSTVF